MPSDPEFQLALHSKLAKVYNAKTGRWENQGLERIGAVVAGAIQQSIRDLRDPPNAPATIERKGSSNPLIDTGFMRLSVSWRVQ